MKPVDVLIIGGGPAGLAGAIRLKQRARSAGKNITVAIIDKARALGAHTLSGAVIETSCLDALMPDWRNVPGGLLSGMSAVKRDEMFFLTARKAFRIPSVLVPSGMKHNKDMIVSPFRLVEALGKQAQQEGAGIYTGFSAGELIWESGKVRGVRLIDQGLNKNREPKGNFLKGEVIEAGVTLLADGARGVLSREYITRLGLEKKNNCNPQVYSIGIKQVFRLPVGNSFGAGRVVYTLGFPNKLDVFGGGFLYSMPNNMVAAGLILGLDWKYTDLDPQQEFEIFKKHPLMASFLEGASVVASGAKVIPEGGWYAMPDLAPHGALLLGDAAGLVNMEKIKGLHQAILSGTAAADAIIDGDLTLYQQNLEAHGVMKEMHHARNFRGCFKHGLLLGAPISLVQHIFPWKIGMKQDHAQMQAEAQLNREEACEFDHAAFAALSNTGHREDEPSHLIIKDPQVCRRCQKEFNKPCTVFCPVEVYRSKGDGVMISPANCVHCGTCAIKCPLENILWTPPEGGEGPHYRMM
jgi:electron-transferring-flavoprotein dehydrogenase